MFKNIGIGLKNQLNAFSYLRRKGWLYFFLFPIVVQVLLFIISFILTTTLTENAMEMLQSYVTGWIQGLWGAEYIGKIIHGLIWLIIKVFTFFALAYFNGFITLILLSPVLSVLSQKVILDQTPTILVKNSFRAMLNSILRGVLIALRNLFLQLSITLLLLILGFVPLFGIITPALLFLVTAFFYGFSFVDYALEASGVTTKPSIRYIHLNKGIVTVAGLPLAFVLLIPFLGSFLGGFIAISSTVSAALTYSETNRLSQQG